MMACNRKFYDKLGNREKLQTGTYSPDALSLGHNISELECIPTFPIAELHENLPITSEGRIVWDAQLQSPSNHKLGVFIFVAWIRRILAGHAETYCKHLWIKARVAVRKGWRFISVVQRVWIKHKTMDLWCPYFVRALYLTRLLC